MQPRLSNKPAPQQFPDPDLPVQTTRFRNGTELPQETLRATSHFFQRSPDSTKLQPHTNPALNTKPLQTDRLQIETECLSFTLRR